ncbi:NUDIX hydrolase [Hathewaya massiliensis]|uniref:NUDIX hydrolase n=1 Tax=Hathewaya massiliensis TaxID=1964382 RepID=UPI0011590D12|nr:NUDIX domain-containing protein [Hathewaya massiliensis]
METIIGCSLIIHDDNKKVLIAQRSQIKHKFPMLWETVGGTLENEETPEECIRREVEEELNCEISELKLFKVYVINSDNRYVLIVYAGKIIGEVKPNIEIEKVQWISRNDINKYEFMGNCKDKIIDFYSEIQ